MFRPAVSAVARAARARAAAVRSVASSSRHHAQSHAQPSNYVPLVTVAACAVTSGAFYYYFMNRTVKNESLPGGGFAAASAADDASEPVEVVEVVEIIEEEPLVSSPSADLEAEAGREGAFNEETGEINWDCPCLGGMAHGPCGEDFKAAFSCFVYSKEEPKGIECIDRFKSMQDCFRKYPEVYSEELRDEEAVERDVVVPAERAVDQAVMNNDIIESVEEAIDEAHQIGENLSQLAYDIYGSAQKKIDDFTSNSKK